MPTNWRKTIFYGRILSFAQWKRVCRFGFVAKVYFNGRSFSYNLRYFNHRYDSTFVFESEDEAKSAADRHIDKILKRRET